MQFTGIKAVLFDLDGTILDTAGDICAAACHAVAAAGLPPFRTEDFRSLIGYGIRSIYADIVPAGTPKDVMERALAEHLRYYPEHCTEQTCFYPGAEELLETLAKRGILLAVITNKVEDTAVKIVRHYCPRIPFREIWGNNGVRPLKPDAQVGRMACEALAVSPEQVLYLGDGDADMRFARNVGFGAIGAAWGYRSREVLLENGAQVLLDRPLDLLDLLG